MLKRVLCCLLLMIPVMQGQIQTVGPFMATPQTVPNPNAKHYPVSGTVVNALTGAPIPRALVQLQGMQPSRAFTGDDGHFELKDVLEGRYSVMAQRPGFQPSTHLNTVTVGAATPSVECKLQPQSSLRGRIVNSDGEPVEGVGVQLLRQDVLNGRRNWQMSGAARSDETGVFVFENLSPGAYLVHTEPHGVFASSSEIVVDGRHYPELYLPQYFPNAPDRSSAQPIQLQPGTESEADFSLPAVPAYQASGVVSDVHGYGAACEGAEGEIVSSAFQIDNRTGKFKLLRLPAGSCTLVVQTGFRPDSQALYGELPLQITDSDLDGLRLSLSPLPDISVQIAGAGANNTDNPGVQLQLVPQKGAGRHPAYYAEKKGDTLAFHAVFPGTYSLISYPSGLGCLASVTSGSSDLMRNDLTVMAGSAPAPITVTMRTDCATILGKLPDTATSATTFVIAVPDGAPAMAKVGVATNGQFQIGSLSPGNYILYAFTDLQNAPYAEPDFLKTVEGQKITVAPNDKPTVQINKVNDTGAGQ